MRIVLSMALLFILASLFLITTASGVAVNVGVGSGPSGSIVQIPVVVEGATKVGSIDIILTYNPEIARSVGVEAGDRAKNAYLESNTAKTGEVRVALADSAGISGNGSVIVVSFKLIGTAGSSTPLTIQQVAVHDVNLTKLTVLMTDGALQITTGPSPTTAGSEVVVCIVALVAIGMGLYLVRGRKW